MDYILTGFSHDMGYRIFAFETTSDRVRTLYRVRADLALARQHRIPVQELPLLCKALLERREEGDQKRAYTFGETEMREYESRCAARNADAQKRKPHPRKPVVQRTGTAWGQRF